MKLLFENQETVSVFVEEPISTEGLTETDVAELRDRVRDAISARVDAYFDSKAAS